MRLNPQKCAFGVTWGKLVWYVISSRGIEAEPSKNQGYLCYNATHKWKGNLRVFGQTAVHQPFISKLTMVCESVFHKLRKNEPKEWDEDYQKEFDTIEFYLSNQQVLKPTILLGMPLLIYLTTNKSTVRRHAGPMNQQQRDFIITCSSMRSDTIISKDLTLPCFGPQRNCVITCSPIQCMWYEKKILSSSYSRNRLSMVDCPDGWLC